MSLSMSIGSQNLAVENPRGGVEVLPKPRPAQSLPLVSASAITTSAARLSPIASRLCIGNPQPDSTAPPTYLCWSSGAGPGGGLGKRPIPRKSPGKCAPMSMMGSKALVRGYEDVIGCLVGLGCISATKPLGSRGWLGACEKARGVPRR